MEWTCKVKAGKERGNPARCARKKSHGGAAEPGGPGAELRRRGSEWSSLGVWAAWQRLKDKNHVDTSCLSVVHFSLEKLGSSKHCSPNPDIPPAPKGECPNSRPLASQCLLHPHAHALVSFADAGGYRTGILLSHLSHCLVICLGPTFSFSSLSTHDTTGKFYQLHHCGKSQGQWQTVLGDLWWIRDRLTLLGQVRHGADRVGPAPQATVGSLASGCSERLFLPSWPALSTPPSFTRGQEALCLEEPASAPAACSLAGHTIPSFVRATPADELLSLQDARIHLINSQRLR